MRLWHQSLLPYLNRQHLLGQHRECCALRGGGWGRKHSVVDYAFTHPREWLWQYHMAVMDEMKSRGYHPDPIWEDFKYRGKTLPPLEEESALENFSKTQPIYPEHNADYLAECISLLESKGYENIKADYTQGEN